MKKTGLLLALIIGGFSLFAGKLDKIPTLVKLTILTFGDEKNVFSVEKEDDEARYFVIIEKTKQRYIYLTISETGEVIDREEEQVEMIGEK